MLGLPFAPPDDRPLRLLCLGAHADDIEIGAGGTILRLLEAHPNCDVRWVVFSATPERAAEARTSADLFLKDAREHTVVIQSFRDGFFPDQYAAIKTRFEEELKPFAPDLIFSHYRHDRHQDHRVISDLTWNTFRDHLILEYEILKYDGDLGQPNVFVSLEEVTCRQKIAHLMASFASQHSKHWFTNDTFWSMLQIRGVEAARSYAEAFYGRKLVW